MTMSSRGDQAQRGDMKPGDESPMYVAIICRRRNSDLIMIWSRPATNGQGAIDLRWCRDNKGDDYVFDLVTL